MAMCGSPSRHLLPKQSFFHLLPLESPRGNCRVASSASLTISCAQHGKHRRGRVGDTKNSLGGLWTFLPMHRNWGQRVGTGGIVRYAEDDEKEVIPGLSPAEETLEILEWPSLCNAVAGFASTAMGKDVCHGLSLPSTKEESQSLLNETSAGLKIDGILGGLLDFGELQTPVVRGGMDRLAKGVVISGNELAAIATLLQVAQTLQRRIEALIENHQSGQDELQPIARLVEPMVVHHEDYKLIWSKVDEDGAVKDTASAQLRKARIQAHSLEQRLQELLNKIVREKTGDDDEQDIIDVDGRLCLVVTAGKASSIPGLLFQRTGTTSYLEPTQAVSLNNKLAEARAEVKSAEHNVLSGIAAKLMPRVNDIHFVLHTIVRLDVIGARGKYSSWIGGQKPLFVDGNADLQSQITDQRARNFEDGFGSDQAQGLLINLRKARHPLLVEQHHHALKKAKAKLKGKQKLLGRARARANSTTATLQPLVSAVAEAEMEVAAVEARSPVPIDVRIGRDIRVVAITGPNTGGKTAAIKAVGLAALMAKVGLYVLAKDPVHIPWFDAVFADIGDEQSLGQSLSTFSGHLLRIKRIMAESTKDSLVLLDELGAGTDPTEGAALGMALLESFATAGNGGSLLTLTTTHHGELKTLKYSDHRFENASVEFDEERLAPTYKLLWGIPGRSNAINIARRLGLPSAILASAQSLYGAANTELNEVISDLEGAKLDFDQRWEDSEKLTGEIREFYSQLVASAQRLYEHKRVIHSEKCEQLATIASASRSALNANARKQQSNSKPSQSVEGGTLSINKHHDISISKENKRTNVTAPGIGQLVYVPKLGRDAKVVEVNSSRKEITVQSGFLQIKVGLKEVQ